MDPIKVNIELGVIWINTLLNMFSLCICFPLKRGKIIRNDHAAIFIAKILAELLKIIKIVQNFSFLPS